MSYPEFRDKIVVVSGGSRGIGRGIVRAFALQGARIVTVTTSQSNLRHLGTPSFRNCAQNLATGLDQSYGSGPRPARDAE